MPHGAQPPIQTLWSRQHIDHRIIGSCRSRLTLQRHSHRDPTAVRLQQRRGEAPIAQIVGNPVYGTSRWHRLYALVQKLAQASRRQIRSTEIHLACPVAH